MNTPELPLAAVRPYFSVIVLEGEDFTGLTDFLLASGRGEVVARHETEDLLAFVRRREDPPTWAGPDAGFVDVTHQLTIALRRGGFLVVCTDRSSQERLQTWLDRRESRLVQLTCLGSAVALAVVVETPGVSHAVGCTPLGPVAWAGVLAAISVALAGQRALPRLEETVRRILPR